jgi:hypothetical protein
VISDANLYKLGDSNSEVTQTVPRGTNVEIIAQDGSWFLIKNSGRSGWMHESTIRLLSPPGESSGPVSTR